MMTFFSFFEKIFRFYANDETVDVEHWKKYSPSNILNGHNKVHRESQLVGFRCGSVALS